MRPKTDVTCKQVRSELYIKHIVALLSILVVAGIAGFLLLKFVTPAHYFGWYPVIPAYFILFCTLLAVIMRRSHRRNVPRKTQIIFFVVHNIMFLLAIFGLLLYHSLIGEKTMEFGITAMFFYLVYKVSEFWLYKDFEKKVREICDEQQRLENRQRCD